MTRFPPIVAALIIGALVAAACGADVRVSLPDQAVGSTGPEPSETGTPAPDPGSPDDPGQDPAGPDTPPETREPTPGPTAVPTPTPQGRPALPDDQYFEPGPRIAVQTGDGQIFTMLGDGSNRVPLTDPSEGTVSTRPTWSPDSNLIAWAVTSPTGADPRLRAARFDGTGWTEQTLPAAPLQLAWDPTSSLVADLGPGDVGLSLGVTSLADGGYVTVDQGSPFWFSWSPSADEFLVHASGVRLDLVPVDGPSQVLEQDPGRFQAPRWLDDPTQLIYAQRDGDTDFLVVAGTDGAGRRALVSYEGYLQFVVAPATGWIALHVIDPALAPVPDVITASFQPSDFEDIVDPVERNQLTVIATFGGDPFVVYPAPDAVTGDPVAAFYWSPDGTALAWLVEREPGDGDCGSETAVYEWQFLVDNAVVSGPTFRPTSTFACDYMPFFDQLDQSVSFWSPDGAVLTYAGTDTITGERGIWNVEVGRFDPPTLVADGDIAVWSATDAATAATSAL